MEQKIALYLRSSTEQNVNTRNKRNPDESDTIANQRKLLRKMALTKGYEREQLVEYVDDGHSGVNFDRPGFQHLLQDVEDGKIAAVMVKDLSRLGRDYIGVGEYVEQYFPARGVRLISINDNWDSDEHVGETMELDTAFCTMIYEMYSRDLSVKRKSANQARNNSGIFIGAFVPYGYEKAPDDAHSIQVDERAAPIVRRIFQMYNSGMKIGEIAKVLNDEGALAPARAKEGMHCYGYVAHNQDLWSARAVGTILRNELYTGTLLLNRYSIKEFRSNVCVKNAKEEWVKFPNNHEAIISQEEFDKAQKRLGKPKSGDAQITAEKKRLPVYCGHCGMKLRGTTKMEGTMECLTGKNIPFETCGQMMIRRDAMEKVLVKAINMQAKVLSDDLKRSKATSKEVKKMKKLVEQLEDEKASYRDKRMGLYKSFKSGSLERDNFLKQKTSVLEKEEECLTELEEAQKKLADMERQLQNAQAGAENFQEYALLKSCDYEIVNRLISRVECFNDGHIKIHWNFKSEFGNAEPMDEFSEDKRKESDGKKGAAVYTSNLFLMPQEEEWITSRRAAENYCHTELGIDDVRFFHDDNTEEMLYFREGYMKFIDAGRRKTVDALVINSFRDLYLSHQDLNDLLFWVIPKLECRFIALADQFDSREASGQDYKDIYDKYSNVRKGDIMRYRTIERKAGIRKAKEPKIPVCSHMYGYYIKEDGCYADKEILELVKKMFLMAKETGALKHVTRWLNKEQIPTSVAFLNAQGIGMTEKVKRWTSEKVWGVTKKEEYVSYCRHYEKCRALGRHCDRKPIIDRALFDEVNEKCRYRKNR